MVLLLTKVCAHTPPPPHPKAPSVHLCIHLTHSLTIPTTPPAHLHSVHAFASPQATPSHSNLIPAPCAALPHLSGTFLLITTARHTANDIHHNDSPLRVQPPHPNHHLYHHRHREGRMVTTGARTGLQQQQQQRQRIPSLKLQQQQQQPPPSKKTAQTTGKRKGSTNRFTSRYRGKSGLCVCMHAGSSSSSSKNAHPPYYIYPFIHTCSQPLSTHTHTH